MNGSPSAFRGGARAITIGLALSGFGTAGLVVGVFVDRRQLFFSYLTAYAFVVSIATGALVFLMICHAMRAAWPVAIRRIVETTVAVFPLLALLFVPLCFGLDALYPWIHPERLTDLHARELVLHKGPYLNVPFFLARTAAFFAIWVVTSTLLRKWSLARDSDPAADVGGRLYVFSAAALPAVALAISFAAFDWLMSLTPTWSSTMFPVYFFAGGFVAAIGLVSVATHCARESGHLPLISDSHYYALGRLLLAFTIFWGYAAFFQFLLIWIANRPDEATYYLTRARGAWRVMTAILAGGQFLLPFCLLLNYRNKRRGSFLAAMGLWILLAHYIDVHWLVAPAARFDRFPLHWLDLSALLAVGGLCVSAALFTLRGRHLLPIHDPRLAEALAYESV